MCPGPSGPKWPPGPGAKPPPHKPPAPGAVLPLDVGRGDGVDPALGGVNAIRLEMFSAVSVESWTDAMTVTSSPEARVDDEHPVNWWVEVLIT